MAWDSDADITSVFKSFGYTPTEAELSALRPSFGEGFGGANAMSAVAQYVNFKNAESERRKNDPLGALETRINDSVDLMKSQVQGLYGQLQDTLSAAPQLFGNMTPDQIQTYLQPLQDTFKTQLSTVQGAMASRGVAGSSTENNALAQTNQQFQSQVLSTGLGIGLDAQKNKAAGIQAQINNLFGLTGTEEQIGAGVAGQKSAQDLGQSNLIASLPSFLNANAAQMAAFNKALNPDTGGFQDKFDQVTGDITKGFNAALPFFNTATTAAQKVTGKQSPFQVASTPGSNAPNLPSNAYATSAGPQDALFATA